MFPGTKNSASLHCFSHSYIQVNSVIISRLSIEAVRIPYHLIGHKIISGVFDRNVVDLALLIFNKSENRADNRQDQSHKTRHFEPSLMGAPQLGQNDIIFSPEMFS